MVLPNQSESHLQKNGSQVELEIVDNGVGFDTTDMLDYDGIGIKSIHERVEQLGATLTIRSALNEGTSVKVVLDLKETNDE